MHRYEQISGVFFTILALVQLTRVVLRWPVQVSTVTVPLWPSVVAFLIAGSLAIWAFKSVRRTAVV